MKILQILILNLLMSMALPLSAADIQVSVDRNPVNVNDSFQLIFTASQSPDADPDFSPLQANFEVLDQQRSSNSSWVNGRSTHTEQWVISVLAKQAGELLIPPIAFGADSSKPLQITVSDNPVNPQSTDELFLEVSASPEKPYVQSQVLYTVRFYRRLQITQARLNEPQLKDAVIEKLGEDSNYNTLIKGMDYAVTERKYAIFPQQSGVVSIEPLLLNAEVIVQRRPSFNGFFNHQSTETRRVTSKAVTLDVQAVPTSFNNASWLSAESLEISEDWSDHSLQTKVGEPLTRTVRLQAKGATVGQLPELSGSVAIEGLKTYPDQPVLKEDKQADGLTALREEKIAFIPSKAGEYRLPALDIQWFNTKTLQVEKVSLPSVSIKALASTEPSPQTAIVSPSPEANLQTVQHGGDLSTSNSLTWQVVSACLALGWLSTCLWFFRSKTRVAPAKNLEPESSMVFGKALKQACLQNNPHAAKQVLLQWGRAEFGQDSLGAIAKNCSQPLAEQLVELNRQLYSVAQSGWKGDVLWQAFNQNKPLQDYAAVVSDGLEPLYKL